MLVSRYVHHLTEEMKELLRVSGVRVPLLSPSHHGAGVCAGLTDQAGEGVCGSYQEQVQQMSFKATSRSGSNASPMPDPCR